MNPALPKGWGIDKKRKSGVQKYILCFLTVLISYNLAIARDNNWRITKTTHFIVYYKTAPESFIKEVIDKSEDYYNKIAVDLGFTRYDFWLWDNRAKIYIHDNAADYQSATGQPKWSAGSAMPGPNKIIQTFPYAQGFFEKILPHEMGHIIFREFVGFDNPAVPFWLDEGVASYQEKLTYSMANTFLKKAIDKTNFITLERLSSFNPHSIIPDEVVQLFYLESFSVVDFLIREFGKDRFVSFCQDLRDKRDLARAMAMNYPFSNIQELDEAWQRYLSEDISYGTK